MANIGSKNVLRSNAFVYYNKNCFYFLIFAFMWCDVIFSHEKYF